jgi:osmotically-inducible protein OsmY
MKGMFFCFALGVAAGAGGYWYLHQDTGRARLAQARTQVVAGAEKAGSAIKDAVGEIRVEDIKEELARTSMVVRDKAKVAGQAIADATANARTTLAIKTKLLAEPGLSALAINVDTTDGLVTLSGKVDSHEQIAKAVKLALDTDGVHKVVSTLQVSSGR